MITDDIEDEFRPHSVPYIVTGTFILWVCWLFFNGGSTYKITETGGILPEKVMMNTILSAASSGLFSIFLKNRILGTHTSRNKYDLGAITNGILAGLVAITGGCHNMENWAAILTGVIGGAVYCGSCKLLQKIKVDDPLEATNVHGFGGLTGLFCIGIFD